MEDVMATGRILALAALFSLAVVKTAAAQMGPNHQINVTIQYHQPVPANGDKSAARVAIYRQVRKDCETAAITFGRKCVINRIFFTDNVGWNNSYRGAPMVNANVDMSLVGEPAQGTGK
jgi:hypothetical protein